MGADGWNKGRATQKKNNRSATPPPNGRRAAGAAGGRLNLDRAVLKENAQKNSEASSSRRRKAAPVPNRPIGRSNRREIIRNEYRRREGKGRARARQGAQPDERPVRDALGNATPKKNNLSVTPSAAGAAGGRLNLAYAVLKRQNAKEQRSGKAARRQSAQRKAAPIGSPCNTNILRLHFKNLIVKKHF